jgi:plasmid stabilization system protein ParE
LKLRVSKEAEQELAAAVAWYEERSEGLGIELVVEVDRVLARITSRPLEAPLWREDRPYRKKVLTRFPFVVFFRVEGELVLVDAIAHARRRPGFWTER